MMTMTTSNSSSVKPLDLLAFMSASLGRSRRYCGIATGPSTGVVDVEVDAVVVVLVLPEVKPVVAPVSDAPETQRLDWPVTPNTIDDVPDWWAPTSGALYASLKLAMRCALPKPGLVEES